MRNTSRTWQPYSSGDQTAGLGLFATSDLPSTAAQRTPKSRTAALVFVASNSPAKNPQSGQRRSSTHVQFLSSGMIASGTMFWQFLRQLTPAALAHGVEPSRVEHDERREDASADVDPVAVQAATVADRRHDDVVVPALD